MATIKDIEVIFTEMELKSLNFYKVFDSDNKSLLTSQQDKDVSPSDAVKELKEFLSKIDGIVNIQVSSKSGDDIEKGGTIRNQIFKYQVRLGAAANGGIISGPEPVPGGSLKLAIEQMQEKFDLRLEAVKKEYEHKAEMDDLRRAIKEIQDGDNITKIGINYLDRLMGSNITPGAKSTMQPAINGPGTGAGITGPGEPSQKTLRLRDAIRKIAMVDPHYVDHLEMLANLAENQPLVYNKAIEQLKEYSK